MNIEQCFVKALHHRDIHSLPECLSLRRNWIPPPPPLQVSVSPPLDPNGGSNPHFRVRGWGDPIRTTGQKAWHSVYFVPCIYFSLRKRSSGPLDHERSNERGHLFFSQPLRNTWEKTLIYSCAPQCTRWCLSMCFKEFKLESPKLLYLFVNLGWLLLFMIMSEMIEMNLKRCQPYLSIVQQI